MNIIVIYVGVQEILDRKSEGHTVLLLKNRKIASDVYGVEVQGIFLLIHFCMSYYYYLYFVLITLLI
jgi:hypothetical protein